MAGAYLVSASTMKVIPARCEALGCPYCVLLQARRRSLAIAHARPERAILLTDVGEDHQEVRARVKRVRYDLAAEVGQDFEWVWHVEPNPRGTGHHIHAWQHGPFVPQRVLSEIADGAGMGHVAFVNRIRSRSAASHYGLKGLGYGLKAVEQGQASTYLALNGARLTHQSRGYFRGTDGARLPVRAAEDAALGASRDRDPGPWRLIRPSAALR